MSSLKAIAVAPQLMQPMELVAAVDVTVEAGLTGDARGQNTGRQVTVLFEEDWQAACDDVRSALPWERRRANFLVNGVDNPKKVGARLRVGEVVLEVTEETKPCQLMERVQPGLRRALEPHWRGGVCCRVMTGGRVAQGDRVDIELPE